MKRDPLSMITGTGLAEFGSRVGAVIIRNPDGSFGPGYQGGTYDFEHMAKSGEGSRGGHVIGHTASGKPIYAPGVQGGKLVHHEQSHPKNMKKLTTEEHHDIVGEHMHQARSLRAAAKEAHPIVADSMRKLADKHHEIAWRHVRAAQKGHHAD